MTFEVSESEWLAAKEALTGKPSGTKFNKYPVEPNKNLKVKWLELRKHSFVIIDKIIYALSNKQDFTPERRDGLVFKKGQTEEGKEVIIEKSNIGSDKYQLVACIPPLAKAIAKPFEFNTDIHTFIKPSTPVIFSPFQMPDLFFDYRIMAVTRDTKKDGSNNPMISNFRRRS